MAIDYEKEYDNLARVPEHPEIFARFAREAATYRETARGAELGVSYGPSPRQIIDLFPAQGANSPLAIFIHGGWWRMRGPAEFSHLACGLNGRGVTVAVAGYDLCPQVTLPAIIDQMRAACLFLWRRYRKRITACGHSAGAHLAACLVATDWKQFASDAPADLVPAAYAVSGIYDLAPLLQLSVNQDLRLDEATARAASPFTWRVPVGRILNAVVGALESSEFLRQSRLIVDTWKDVAKTRFEAVAGANHFTVIAPLSDRDSAMTARVVQLAENANAISG